MLAAALGALLLRAVLHSALSLSPWLLVASQVFGGLTAADDRKYSDPGLVADCTGTLVVARPQLVTAS